MSTGLLTSTDIELALTIGTLYPASVAIQGYAGDDAVDWSDIETAEFVMGVDGVLSAGYVPKEVTQGIMLQADSDSCLVFENWYLNNVQQRTTIIASGTLIVPSTQRQYNLVRGFLKDYSPAPNAKKILQPRKFSIVWNKVVPAAYAGI